LWCDAEFTQELRKCGALCRNAEVSNTFKVDLHALHVDEAVAEMEKTIQDLSRFKCKPHLLLQ